MQDNTKQSRPSLTTSFSVPLYKCRIFFLPHGVCVLGESSKQQGFRLLKKQVNTMSSKKKIEKDVRVGKRGHQKESF